MTKITAAIVLVILTSTASAQTFNEEGLNNCQWSKQGVRRAWDCAKIAAGIKTQLKRERKFRALAANSTNELERKAYLAEAEAAKAGAAYLLSQWQEFQK